jgi:hypothetical protein
MLLEKNCDTTLPRRSVRKIENEGEAESEGEGESENDAFASKYYVRICITRKCRSTSKKPTSVMFLLTLSIFAETIFRRRRISPIPLSLNKFMIENESGSSMIDPV